MTLAVARIVFAFLLPILGFPLAGDAHALSATQITVFADPDCDCCKKWVEYLKREGFAVQVEYRSDLDSINDMHQVPRALRGCHVATVDGYILEGHVPAEDIKRLLRMKPKAVGLAVPGMPIGSPGMEQGSAKTPFGVVLFGNGTTSSFSMH